MNRGKDAKLSQWFTPEKIVDAIFGSIVNVNGASVIDLACGDGRLLQAALDWGASSVRGLEIDDALAKSCHDSLNVTPGDGLKAKVLDGFDFAVINPPFDHGKTPLFIAKALESAKTVVCVMRVSDLTGVKMVSSVWANVAIDCIYMLIRRPRFDGPKNQSPKGAFCVVVMHRRLNGEPRRPVDVVWIDP